MVFPQVQYAPLGVNGHQGDQLLYLPGDKLGTLDWATEGPDVLVWHDIGIALRFSRFYDSRGDLNAMVRIYTRGVVGYPDRDLYDARIVLTGSRSKTDAVKACHKLVPDWPYWDETVNRACRIVRTFIEEGTPPVDLSLGDDPPEPPWLLEPLFRCNENALLFGDGGTGKSTLALWFSLSMAPTQRVLYLDFEDSEAEMRRHLRAIARGMNMDPIDRPVMYKEADLGLPQMAEALCRYVAAANIRGLVVDSAAMACGVEPEKAEAAIAYFRAIRTLHLDWTLTIAHQPKDKANSKYPFGSIFWWNTPRNIWRTRTAQEPGEGQLHVGLWHEKANNRALQKPLGYQIARHDGQVAVQQEEPRRVEGFRASLSQNDQLVAALEDAAGQPMSYADIAGCLGIPVNQTYMVVRRCKRAAKAPTGGFILDEYA